MCTNITIKSKDNNVIVGRSMENAVFLESKIFFRAEGYKYNQVSFLKEVKDLLDSIKEEVRPDVGFKGINLELLYSWEGKYSFVGLNAKGIDVASHGMNSKGLVTGDMTLTESIYESFDTVVTPNLVFYLYLTNWILSTCATCQDVKENLKKICVIDPFVKMNPGFFFHFPVNDALGNAIVIEYVNGELQMHDNEIGVLTNDPLFPWQRRNLDNYVNISPVNFPSVDIEKGTSAIRPLGNIFNANTLAQGTGFIGLPGSSTPPDRFVRAAMMSNYIYQPKDASEAVNVATHILNTVDIPIGTSREYFDSTADKQESDFTQWVAISDTKNLKYYIRRYESPLMYLIDFETILLQYKSNPEGLNNLTIDFPENDLAINLPKKPEIKS
nr:linear amide C-N hydrolase [uncultured Flavobacterium sp.]